MNVEHVAPPAATYFFHCSTKTISAKMLLNKLDLIFLQHGEKDVHHSPRKCCSVCTWQYYLVLPLLLTLLHYNSSSQLLSIGYLCVSVCALDDCLVFSFSVSFSILAFSALYPHHILWIFLYFVFFFIVCIAHSDIFSQVRLYLSTPFIFYTYFWNE